MLTIHLATLTTGLAGLLLYQVPGWSGAWLVLLLVGCVLAIVAVLETAGRRNRRLTSPLPSPAPPTAADASPRPSEPVRS